MESSIGIVRSLCLLCALAAAALACGSETETAPPDRAAEPPPVAESRGVEPKVAPPVAFQRALLPEDIPQDVPQYPGGDLSDARIEPGGGMFASFSTGDAAEKVSAFYRDALEATGWRIESERRLLIFASKKSRTLTVFISEEGDMTQFEVILLGVD